MQAMLLTLVLSQPPAVEQASESVCVVHVSAGDGSWYTGRGCYVGDRRVLTCSHLFRHGSEGTAYLHERTPCYVTFGRRRVTGCVRIALDDAADLAVVLLPRDPGVRPLRLAAKTTLGATYWLAGRAVRGPMRALEFADGTRHRQETVVLSGRGVSGDSGGPLLSESGEVAGVWWGSLNRGRATRVRRVRRVLE